MYVKLKTRMRLENEIEFSITVTMQTGHEVQQNECETQLNGSLMAALAS